MPRQCVKGPNPGHFPSHRHLASYCVNVAVFLWEHKVLIYAQEHYAELQSFFHCIATSGLVANLLLLRYATMLSTLIFLFSKSSKTMFLDSALKIQPYILNFPSVAICFPAQKRSLFHRRLLQNIRK